MDATAKRKAERTGGSGSPNALKKYSARDPTDMAVASEDETLARVDTVNIEGGGGDTGLALRGMDCVSFHLIDASDPDGAPLQGSTDFEVIHENVLQGRVVYRFANQEHADRFKNGHFSKFTPQYGGFCALCVANGKLAHADPMQWRIREGKLFLFGDKEMKEAWDSDHENLETKAVKNWPALAAPTTQCVA